MRVRCQCVSKYPNWKEKSKYPKAGNFTSFPRWQLSSRISKVSLRSPPLPPYSTSCTQTREWNQARLPSPQLRWRAPTPCLELPLMYSYIFLALGAQAHRGFLFWFFRQKMPWSNRWKIRRYDVFIQQIMVNKWSPISAPRRLKSINLLQFMWQ